MRDAARSGGSRWTLGNWDLRWKVTAVLAVPLLVAVALGAFRITAQFGDSSDMSAAAKRVSTIPAISNLCVTGATVAMEQAIMLGPDKSLVSDADLAALDAAITAAERATTKLSAEPSAKARLDEMITMSKAIRAGGASPSANISDASGPSQQLYADAADLMADVLLEVNDSGIQAAKLRLISVVNARAMVVIGSAGLAEMLRGDTKNGLNDLVSAANTEKYLINTMARQFPPNDERIVSLQKLVQDRIDMVSSGPQVQAGQLPVADLRQSALDTVAEYQKVVDPAIVDITGRVNTLADNSRGAALRYAVIVVFTILAALLFAVLVARAMILPLRKLRLAALRVAEHDLGHEVARLRDGARPEDVPLEPMPVHTEEEIGQLARAVDDIHGQALRLAADQAAMRTQVNDMFETLARRSKSLVDHQLTLIEAMEYDEKDPRLLENLFRLDHLAARMRRNGDNLLILAGTRQRRGKSAPVEIADVLRAAISEVEDYERVKLGATPRGAVTEPAASDLAHLFAELLDNALRASPPETDVKFTFAQAHDQGVLIEVADRGIGMPPAEMAEINRRLEITAEPGPETARHMGLFVVGRLAERHGLTVRLRPTFDTARDPGVTVAVHVPRQLLVAPAGGTVTVPPQAGTQSVPLDEPTGSGSSMQTRAVTRTPSGNMMVTVDPGVSGPMPAGSRPGTGPVPVNGPAGSGPMPAPGGAPVPLAARTATGPVPPAMPPAANGASGLPQRQPGNNIPAGLPQRNPGTNGPTVRHTLAGSPGAPNSGLPQRDPSAANLGPQGPGAPQGPGPQQGGPAPQPGLAASMLRRQQPAPDGQLSQPPQSLQWPSGMPRNAPMPPNAPLQPPAAGPQPGQGGPAPLGPSGLPQRQPGTSPQPQPGGPGMLGGFPSRRTPSVPPANGAPLSGGPVPPAPNAPAAPLGGSGLPQREPGAGLPQRDANNGLPQRDATGGLPQRDATGGLPQRDATGGLPQRDSALSQPNGVLPQRDPNGLPQREPNGLLPQREPNGGLPQREPNGTLPQRDSGLIPRNPQQSGPIQRTPQDSGPILRNPQDSGPIARNPQDSGPLSRNLQESGPIQRNSGPIPRAPQDATLSGPASGSIPRVPKDPAANGALGLPPRDSAPIRREPGMPGLPQREPGSTSLPPRAGSAPVQDVQAPSLPVRDTGAVLPQRDPGAVGGGLPQRTPGAGLPPRPLPTPGLSLPAPDLSGSDTAVPADARGDQGRHSFRPNPQKTAAFFQTRLQPAAEEPAAAGGGTPIFAEMMSAWLSDPNADKSQAAANFESAADEGWQAARRAVESESAKRTASGLPQRDPGNRLVPGGVVGNADRTTTRDPESIKSSLSRHQQGVRDGRAMREMNLTGDKGDR